jgi:hypothetical protein
MLELDGREIMSKVSDSEFYMWRTLFALAHADEVVTNEEIRFMAEALEDIPFSPEQRAILSEDIKYARDIGEMFTKITSKQDQARLFSHARELVWADGDFGKQEQDIMIKLIRKHVKDVDLRELVGSTGLEWEDGGPVPTPGPWEKENKDEKTLLEKIIGLLGLKKS